MNQVVQLKAGADVAERPFKITMRAMRHCVWHRQDRPGYGLDVYELTEQCGLAAMLVRPSDAWYTDVPVALICNEPAFLQAEYLGEGEPVNGFLFVEKNGYSDLISWLQKRQRAPRLYLYCDFDSYGLALADHIISQVPEAILYVPQDIETVWPKYGRHQRFDPQHFDLSKSSLRLSSPELQRVARLIHQYKTGLPLEVLTILEKEEPSFL